MEGLKKRFCVAVAHVPIHACRPVASGVQLLGDLRFRRAIEETLGWKKFLILYLSSGVVGGICQVLAALLWPGLFGGPVVGASAGGFGLMAAFAVLFPERELVLLLFFILPIRLSAKMLLMLSAVLALAGIVFPISHIANAAHLGGMLTGVIFIRQFVQGRWMAMGIPFAPRRARANWSAPARAKVALAFGGQPAGRRFVHRRICEKRGGPHPRQNFPAGHPEPDGARTRNSRKSPRANGETVIYVSDVIYDTSTDFSRAHQSAATNSRLTFRALERRESRSTLGLRLLKLPP